MQYLPPRQSGTIQSTASGFLPLHSAACVDQALLQQIDLATT